MQRPDDGLSHTRVSAIHFGQPLLSHSVFYAFARES